MKTINKIVNIVIFVGIAYILICIFDQLIIKTNYTRPKENIKIENSIFEADSNNLDTIRKEDSDDTTRIDIDVYHKEIKK